MSTQGWNKKLYALLHSLDILHGSRVCEVKKFSVNSVSLQSKIKSVKRKYDALENENTGLFSDKDLESDEYDEMSIPDELRKLLDNLKDGDASFLKPDPLIDSLLIWFNEMIILNGGKFKITREDDGSITIGFESDELVSNGNKINITDEMLEHIRELDSAALNYISDNTNKKKPTKRKTTKTPSNKNREGENVKSRQSKQPRKKRPDSEKTKDEDTE